MVNMTANLGEKLLDHIFNNTSWTSPATVYLALYTSECDDETPGTEVSGGAYARRPISLKNIQYAAGKVQGVNDGGIEFPEATADWGTPSYVGIWSHLTSTDTGYYLFWGEIDTPIECKTGYVLRIVDGEATVSID